MGRQWQDGKSRWIQCSRSLQACLKILTKGDVIAVAGATGNAANVAFKHCHLTIYVDQVECTTPSEYIKTKFDSNGVPDHGHEDELVASNNN